MIKLRRRPGCQELPQRGRLLQQRELVKMVIQTGHDHQSNITQQLLEDWTLKELKAVIKLNTSRKYKNDKKYGETEECSNTKFVIYFISVTGDFMNTSTATNPFSFSWKTSPRALQEAESSEDGCGRREPSACDGNVSQSALADNPEMSFNTLNTAGGRGGETAGPALQACFLQAAQWHTTHQRQEYPHRIQDVSSLYGVRARASGTWWCAVPQQPPLMSTAQKGAEILGEAGTEFNSLKTDRVERV